MKTFQEKTDALARVLSLPKNNADFVFLLDDIFTPSEIEKAYERILIIDCLEQGISQRETVRKTGSAIATITRGAMLFKKQNHILPRYIEKARKLAWWRRFF